MRYAIVGSRTWPIPRAVINYVNNLPPDSMVISGGALGVDVIATQTAQIRGLDNMTFKPDWNKYGKAAGFIRNKLIVEAADVVVAFWHNQSKGTEHSINLARELKKPLVVYTAPVVTAVEISNLINENSDYRSVVHWQDITL